MPAPKNKYKAGQVSVTQWEDDRYSVENNYKDDNGEWKKTNTYYASQLLELKKAVDAAIEARNKPKA